VLSGVFVGRIHSAVVTGVNLETNSVTVEWLEKNEIKGKEARVSFIMVTLCNKADHYIFAVVSFFFLSFFSRLVSAVGNWMSTILPHIVWP